MTEPITYEQHGKTGLIALDDGKANAFNHAFIENFHAQLDRAEHDAAAVAIVGRPGLLSGGFDLAVVRSGDEQAIVSLVNAGARLVMRLFGFPRPVIVGATGHAVALGAFMLLAADYRIGTLGEFKIGLNEIAIGLSLPEFGIMLASARISPRNLTRATIGATLYDPNTAIEIGYLDEAVTSDALTSAALARAEEMAELDGPAFAQSKTRLRGGSIQQALNSLS